ncbi:MAG TPA: hypothetical protein VGK07_00560 [Candidatus Limnocylindria bacterium]
MRSRRVVLVGATGLAVIALIFALRTLSGGPEAVTPGASATASLTPSPTSAVSASATVSLATSAAATVRPLGSGEWANASLNYAVTLPKPWRYSFEESKVFANDQVTAAVDVYTWRDPAYKGLDPDWKVKILVSRDRQGLNPEQWANAAEGGTGPVTSATVDGRPAATRDNTDGINRQGSSPPLFRHTYVRDGPLMYDISGQQGCCVLPPTIQAGDVASIVQSFRFLGAASKPGTATIAGAVRYPSEFLPAQIVYAIDVKDSTHFYRVETPQSSSQVWYRLADVAPGTYVVVAYTTQTAPGTTGFSGGYTRYVLCGMTPPCPHDPITLVQLGVAAGDYLLGIDPADWAGSYPPRPR